MPALRWRGLHAEGTALSSELTVSTACFRARLPVQQMACLLHFIVLEAVLLKERLLSPETGCFLLRCDNQCPVT